MKPIPCILVGALALGLAACSSEERTKVDAAQSASVVSWPALKTLDELSHQADILIEDKKLAELAPLAPKVKEAALKVAGETAPANALDLPKVTVLQQDLKSAAESIGDPATAKPEELGTTIEAIHTIVETLVEASGLPHEHGAHDGHEGHNH